MRLRGWIFISLIFIACASTGLADTGHPHGDRFDLDCAQCHTVDDWRPLRGTLEFEHLSTGFPLDGAHIDAGCQDCHESLEFSQIGTTCGDCHADPHLGELGFDCQTCHDSTTWESRRAVFDVHSATLFPLLAAHAALECEACHGGQQARQFATTPTDCYSCHLTDFTSTTDPDHVAAGFSTECETCHSPVAARWDEAVFQHPPTFVLSGAHARADCESCHSQGFVGTPTDCASCHLGDYQSTTDPDHAAAGFPLECETCHDTGAWAPALFDHNLTGFPLRGQHRVLDCETCHTNGFTGTPTDCFSCHRDDYRSANDPDHSGFPTACESCHGESGWEGAVFDHSATGFLLRGAHQPLDCEACHSQGFAGTPTDCFSCHRSDYQSTRDPDHVAAGFPTTCETCHGETTWDGAVFDHNRTAFPLRNSHADVDCESCHADGFAGTPTDCFSCHATEYNQTRDPDHQAARFPTTCESCHRPTRWEDSDWDHLQFFPIFSGEHRGEWDTCADCHVAPGNFAIFECIFCHEHRQSEMDDEHDDVSGYRWESRACLDCHPDGDE